MNKKLLDTSKRPEEQRPVVVVDTQPIPEITTATETAIIQRPFYNYPTSPAERLIMSIFQYGKSALIKDQNGQWSGDLSSMYASHSAKIEVQEIKNTPKRRVKYTSGNETVEITLPDVNKLSDSKKKPAKKMFAFFLAKIAEQALDDGNLTREDILFSLKELIDYNMYENLDTARKGFKTAYEQIAPLGIEGTSVRGSKKSKTHTEIKQDTARFMFTGYDINNGECTIYLNSKLNWSFLVQYYTLMPKWAFGLSSRAFDLTYYIFTLARQNLSGITDRGYFTIRMSTIQNYLQIPSASPNPRRDIIDPIDNAITEIEEASHTEDFTLTPKEIGETASSYLNGYLEIGMKGEYVRYYADLEKRFKKRIEQAEKRRKAIQEKAEALRLLNAENKASADKKEAATANQ